MNFWDTHSVLFVACMFLFPRLTMLLGTTFGGGFLYWLGWIFAPRFTVATIATMLYADTNLIMVVLSWMWALGGEASEKATISKAS